MSVLSYQRVRHSVETPLETECRLIAENSTEMAGAWETGARGAALMPALHRNREMWGTFAAACGASGNALPPAVRAQIMSIALWVDRFTSEVVAGRETVDDLLSVNRDMLEGLSGTRAVAA